MKTKITLIVIETIPYFRQGIPPTKILVDKNGKFPSGYISTKTVEDTIKEILSNHTSLSPDFLCPTISKLFHEKGSDECEAIYTCVVQNGIIGTKNNSKMLSIEEINIDERYTTPIIAVPRSI
jgi:hypothetical protein